ncbi:MAG: hypothetical protein N2235_11630 [Fischerella sp.]|nr:hypothetical protein [Fischerella sp.]
MEHQLNTIINQLVKNYLADLEKDIKTKVLTEISEKLAAIDMQELVRAQVKHILENKLQEFSFPEKSIPAEAIKGELSVSANNILPGIIKNFESTGIQDSASDCIITVLDNATVIENKLVASELEIIGNTVLNGSIEIKGEIATNSSIFRQIIDHSKAAVLNNISNDLYQQFQQTVLENLRHDGIDLSKIKLNGKEIIVDNELSTAITQSNLESVGALKELQVIGETLLTSTLYTGNKRVGINTIEPNSALSIWDEEIDISIGKHSANTAKITSRNNIVLGPKAQLKLDTDGNVNVSAIRIGNVEISSSNTPPTDSKPKGFIVFNENPNLGGPSGWVSLGGGRWANFGIID